MNKIILIICGLASLALSATLIVQNPVLCLSSIAVSGVALYIMTRPARSTVRIAHSPKLLALTHRTK